MSLSFLSKPLRSRIGRIFTASAANPGNKRVAARCSSTLEPLEARIAPAAVVAKLIDGPDGDGVLDTLSIKGTARGDVLTVTDLPATDGGEAGEVAATIRVIGTKLDQSFPSDTIERVVFALSSGNDRLTYTLGGLDGIERAIAVDLGRGANAFDFTAGILENDASLGLRITGGSGSDEVDVTFGEIAAGAKVTLTENLGAGVDPSTLNFASSITDEETLVIANINLGTGNNAFTTNFRSDDGFFLYNGATLKQTIIGSTRAADRDTVRGFLSGQVSDVFGTNGSFSYDAILGAGNDTSSFGIDYNADAGVGVVAYGGRVHIGMLGGAGNDSLLVDHTRADGTSSVGGDAAFLDGGGSFSGSLIDVALAGGAGNDAVAVDFGDGGFEINTGAVLRVQAFGDQGFDDPSVAGVDTVSIAVEVAADSTGGKVDLLVRGDDGDDNLTLDFTDNSGTAEASDLASINAEADGGEGNDTCAGTPVLVLRCP